MHYKMSRRVALLAILVLLAAAAAGAIINYLNSEKPLREVVSKAGYHPAGNAIQSGIGYGVSQRLAAKAGTCQVLIFRRNNEQGYWYTTYYNSEQLSSGDTLPSAQEATKAITRLTGATCAI